MKWIILNETPGRIRARLVTARRYAEDGRASKMTAGEADLAQYALLAADGVIVVVLTLEARTNQLLAGPDIISRGFVYVREAEELMAEAQRTVEDAVAWCLDRHISDWGKIKGEIKDALSAFVWKRTMRRPMILPIIMEAYL